jgi:hypothetical protein
MRREMQLSLDQDANHRALRRCCRCGAYARPFDEVAGSIRCERCAMKARREEDDTDAATDETRELVV